MTSAIDVPSALPSAEAGSSATVAESPASEDAVQSDSSQQQQEQQQELQQQYDDEPYKQQQQGQQQQVREELGSTDTTSMTVGVVFGTSLPAIEATPKGRRGRKPKSMQRLAHNGNSESSPVTSNSNNGANTPRYMTRRTNSNTSVATEHEAAQTLESNEIMSSLMNNDLFAGNDGAGMVNTEKSGASTPAWNMASVFDTTAGLKSPQRRGRPPKHSSRSNRRGASEAPSSIVALPELSSGGSEISAEHIKPREERPYTDFVPDIDLNEKLLFVDSALSNVAQNLITTATTVTADRPIEIVESGVPQRLQHPSKSTNGSAALPTSMIVSNRGEHLASTHLVTKKAIDQLPKATFRLIQPPHSLLVPTETITIVGPNSRNAPLKEPPPIKIDYSRPATSYIVHRDYIDAEHAMTSIDGRDSSSSSIKERIEYDMDEQDKYWVEKHNESAKSQKWASLNMKMFEYIIDLIEKEWFEVTKSLQRGLAVLQQTQMGPLESECSICGEDECENSNAIVYCDGCNIAVHQECYGVPYIPEGQWLCRKCSHAPDNLVKCLFCPHTDGAFKQTNSGLWAHVLCSLWIPETGFANQIYMEPIDGIELIPKSRWKLLCSLCGKRGGACIQCSNRMCYVAFHPMCAAKSNLTMHVKSDKTTSNPIFKAYCEKHSDGETCVNDMLLNLNKQQERNNKLGNYLHTHNSTNHNHNNGNNNNNNNNNNGNNNDSNDNSAEFDFSKYFAKHAPGPSVPSTPMNTGEYYEPSKINGTPLSIDTPIRKRSKVSALRPLAASHLPMSPLAGPPITADDLPSPVKKASKGKGKRHSVAMENEESRVGNELEDDPEMAGLSFALLSRLPEDTSRETKLLFRYYSPDAPIIPEYIAKRVISSILEQHSSNTSSVLDVSAANSTSNSNNSNNGSSNSIYMENKWTITFKRVAKYWALKRQHRNGAPLLKRLHLEPWTANSTDLDGTGNDEENIRKTRESLDNIKRNLTRVMVLSELVRKREREKLRAVRVLHQYTMLMLAPVSTALRSVHDNVTRLDIQDVFAEPVPISVYPDYYETIKKPMDLSTMSSKINNFEYITFDEYLSDINLIISNCHKYNPYTSYYSRYAYRFKHAIQPILDRAKLSIGVMPIDQSTGFLNTSFDTGMFDWNIDVPRSDDTQSERIPATFIPIQFTQSSSTGEDADAAETIETPEVPPSPKESSSVETESSFVTAQEDVAADTAGIDMDIVQEKLSDIAASSDEHRAKRKRRRTFPSSTRVLRSSSAQGIDDQLEHEREPEPEPEPEHDNQPIPVQSRHVLRPRPPSSTLQAASAHPVTTTRQSARLAKAELPAKPVEDAPASTSATTASKHFRTPSASSTMDIETTSSPTPPAEPSTVRVTRAAASRLSINVPAFRYSPLPTRQPQSATKKSEQQGVSASASAKSPSPPPASPSISATPATESVSESTTVRSPAHKRQRFAVPLTVDFTAEEMAKVSKRPSQLPTAAYKPGTIVWARMPGYSHFPAEIVDPMKHHAVSDDLRSQFEELQTDHKTVHKDGGRLHLVYFHHEQKERRTFYWLAEAGMAKLGSDWNVDWQMIRALFKGVKKISSSAAAAVYTLACKDLDIDPSIVIKHMPHYKALHP